MNKSKVALVTGGGRGIGAATAKLLVINGYAVCVNYKSNKASAEQVVEDIKVLGGQAIAVQADVANEQDVKRLFQTIDNDLGNISVLVNNAGVLKPQSQLVDMTADRINLMFTNNVTSSFLCCQQAIVRMAISNGGQGGAIVNVSSGAARTGSPNEYIDYAATKGAIDTLTIGLAKEVANEGIRVNGVRPGFIHTDMHADGGEPERIERLTPVIPLSRGGQATEVAEAIYWLASDKSSFSTGTFIDVTGGL